MTTINQYLTKGALSALMAVSSLAHAALPIETWETDSGAKVLFMQTEALPMLDIEVAFPAGDRADPADKAGLATLVAGLLGTATEQLTEQQIADGFADTGAQVSSSSAQDYASVELRTLTSQPELDQTVDLLAQVLQRPRFDKAIFDREVKRAISGLKESLTQPDTLASRAFSKALYPEHPYGLQVTPETLGRIELKDLERFYQSRYLGNEAVVAMVGDLTVTQAKEIANRLTANLPLNTLTGNPLGGLSAETLQGRMEGQTIVIGHPAAQSHITVGLPAMVRGTEAYFDLLVANHVIGGGGFTSRLMKAIREDRGLAYSTYSYFRPSGDAGPYQASVQTKKEQTLEALNVLRATLFEYIEQGPTPEELEAAKSNLIDGFPLRIDSNSALVRNLTMLGVYDMPLDFLDTWPGHIAKVTVESAKKAFAAHVRKDKLVTVVVGPEELTP